MAIPSSASMPWGPDGESAPLVGDRAFAIDALSIAVISAAIVWAADQLLLMTLLVPGVVLARVLAIARLPRQERTLSPAAELVTVVGLALVGGFNDHSSVVRHRIYDYAVPAYFPELSTIPLWMLLYWGLILRFVITLTRYHRMTPTVARDDIYLGRRPFRSARLKVAIQLGLVLTTRQLVYRFYDDPLLSWLPFAVGLGLYFLLFRPDAAERRLALLFASGGPLVEVLYIQLGGLHRYQLGWLGGVPLWIALWWVLAVLILRDLAARVLRRIAAASRVALMASIVLSA